MTHQTLLVQLPITPGVLEAIPIPPGVLEELPVPPGVQADSPVPGVGRTSSVTGHKTSAVSRPCISKTIAWRSWQNSEQNQSKHSKRLGQCMRASGTVRLAAKAVSNGQSNVFTSNNFNPRTLHYCDYTSGATLHILGSIRDQQQQHLHNYTCSPF